MQHVFFFAVSWLISVCQGAEEIIEQELKIKAWAKVKTVRA